MLDEFACGTGTGSSSSVGFNDTRCADECTCVYPTDSLLFTCELHEVFILRIKLPNGVQEVTSLGDDSELAIRLPAGFDVVELNITEIDELTRNISLTFSIAYASLLDDGMIICDDTTPNIVLMVGCPVCGKFWPIRIQYSD